MSYLTRYKLSDLYDLASGISTTPSQAGHGFPFCSFTTIFNNPILPDELPDLMETSEKEQTIYSIKYGDVLITRTSETLDELAMSSVALKDYPNATYSGFAKRLRPKNNNAYPKFMAFFFRSEYFRKIINNKAIMTLRASFNEDIFNDIEFDLPPLEDQIKAGDFLYDIELKIRNSIKLSKDYQKVISFYFNYWFMQYEFELNGKSYKSNNGSLTWNDKLKQNIPVGWNVLKIKDLIDIEVGGDWGKDTIEGNYTKEVYCIRGTDIPDIRNGNKANLPLRYILEKNSNKRLSNGCYVIEVSGTPGRSIYINNNLLSRFDRPIIASNFCYAFKLKNIKYLYWFDLLWLKLYEQGVTKGYSGKTTIANLLFDSLADSVYVAVPPESIIDKFNELVEPMYENIQGIYAENETFNQFREFLTKLFMTGQVKIR